MATMTPAAMRKAVSDAYSSAEWKQKVKYMPSTQIVAIYTSFRQRGIIHG